MADHDKKDVKRTKQRTSQSISDNRTRTRRRSRSSSGKLLRTIQHWFSWRITLISGLVIIVVVGVILAVLITVSISNLRNTWESLDRNITRVLADDITILTLQDFNQLQVNIDDMSQNLKMVRQRIWFIAPVTTLNQEWRTMVDSLDIAQELTNATHNMLQGLQPTLNFMVSGDTNRTVTTQLSSGERLVELLELGRGQFISASNDLGNAEFLLDNLQLENVSPDLLLQIEDASNYHQTLFDLNQLLISSPDILTIMLGLDDERSYLVLAQNNDELRPSGGYISTFGWFTVRNGRIIDYDYSPTTATSPNPPSESFLIEQNINIPDWWIQYSQAIYVAWDGSWFADFPSTAQMAGAYYDAGNNPQSPVDGVVAIDISGFELMLDAVGEVFVPQYDIVVTRNNFRETVYNIRAFGNGVLPHKEFVAAIYRAIFEEWSQLEESDTASFLEAILTGFQQRHLMLYFTNDELNSGIETLNWSGQQQSGLDNDYLFVVDANLGNKSNNSVEQSLTYDVEILADGSLNNRLTIGLEYFDDIASQDPAIDPVYHGALDYHSLSQIFLPVNTVISDADSTINYELINQDNHTLLVSQSVVEYDTSERYQISYTTQPLITELGDLEVYRLLVQNQAGSRAQNLNIQVRLPIDAELVSTSPDASANYILEQPIIEFRLELDRDYWIEVFYQSE